MKWFILALFIFGALWEVFAWWGYRSDQRKGQSADVAMGNMIPAGIGFCIWGLDVIILVIWSLVK